jgi:hypothetical protein
MSAALRQQTCAACGRPFVLGDVPELEVLVDDGIRYVAVHRGPCTTHPPRRLLVELVEQRLGVTLDPWQRWVLAHAERR